MNIVAPELQSPSHVARCSHRTRQGRLCRLPALDSHTGLCFRHSGLRNPKADPEDLSSELLAGVSHLESMEDIHDFLSRLLVLMVRNRISHKRAAILTYICSQLTRTHSALARQAAGDDDDVVVIVDTPRPIRPDAAQPSIGLEQ